MFINNQYSCEPLIFITAKNKNYYMIDFLIKQGVDINKQYQNEYVISILIKNSGLSEYIMKLVKNPNTNIDIFDSESNHFIFLLIKYQYISVLEYIIKHRYENFDLDIIDKNNNPLIYKLLDYGYRDLALFIINKGCNVNAINNRGNPLIFKMLQEKKYNAAALLMNTNKVDLTCKNIFTNISLFELLVQENLFFYVKFMLEKPNFIIPHNIISNYSLIEIAAKNNNTLILNKLILYECAKKIQKIVRGFIIKRRHSIIL